MERERKRGGKRKGDGKEGRKKEGGRKEMTENESGGGKKEGGRGGEVEISVVLPESRACRRRQRRLFPDGLMHLGAVESRKQLHYP